MAIRLALKADLKAGEALLESKLASVSALCSRQRNLGLFTYLSKIGCQASEKDLLSRIREH